MESNAPKRVPPYHVPGRLAVNLAQGFKLDPSLRAYAQQEWLVLESHRPFLAHVRYRDFRDIIEKSDRDVLAVLADRTNLAPKSFTVERTGLRLSLLSGTRGGFDAYQILGGVSKAIGNRRKDVTEALFEQHSRLLTGLTSEEDPCSREPVLHIGTVMCPQGFEAEEMLIDPLEEIVPTHIKMGGFALINLPKLPS